MRHEAAPGESRGGHPLVAAFHLGPEPGDVAGNLLLAEDALTRAKRAHPRLRWAVLPELFTSAYSGLYGIHRHAEDAREGTSARFFAALARELDLYIAYGFPERPSGTAEGQPGGVSDSVNLIGPGGLVLTYRKRHLVRSTAEPEVFVPGTCMPVVRAGGARVAIAVCWDLGFPEVVREAALAGADLVLAPAGWRHPWGAQYDLSCAARALDNAVYLASANQIGDYPEARFDAPGGVYGPNGVRISEGAGPISTGEVDPAFPERWRASFGSTILRAPGTPGSTVPPQPAHP